MFNINLLINNFVYNNEEVTIDTYRRLLVLFFHLIIMSLFSIFAVVFFINGNNYFAFIKTVFALMSLSTLIIFKNKENYLFHGMILGILLVVYSLISFLDSTEARYGFIWSFFVPSVFVFLLGYKKGFIPAFLYSILIFCIALYDSLYVHNQFLDLIAFSLFYSAYIAFFSVCLLIDYFFVLFHNKILNISVTDPLTKLFNRRKIDEVLKGEFSNKNILSVAILDIDNFKLINDEKGHHIGDEVLKIFATNLERNIRATDIVGRWGGEEFIVVLPNTSSLEAYKCMEKIQNHNKTLNYKYIDKLTCSFGISSSINNELTLNELITQADKALYKAKKEGKDKIIIFDKTI